MRNSLRTLACILTVSATMTGAGIAPSVAQTTVEPQAPMDTTATTATPTMRHHHYYRRRMTRAATSSAPTRNVGPSSTIGGNTSNIGGGRAGVPAVPGAPDAGPVGGGSGQ